MLEDRAGERCQIAKGRGRIASEAAPSDRRGLGVSRSGWEQRRRGEAASLLRDRNLQELKVWTNPARDRHIAFF